MHGERLNVGYFTEFLSYIIQREREREEEGNYQEIHRHGRKKRRKEGRKERSKGHVRKSSLRTEQQSYYQVTRYWNLKGLNLYRSEVTRIISVGLLY